MHEKYGPVVRVAPDELSFIDPEAYRDIYGHRPGGELPKAFRLLRGSSKIPPSLLVTQDISAHRALRRRLAPAFSEKALRDQEPIITRYVDLLLTRLGEVCQGGRADVDLRLWYRFEWLVSLLFTMGRLKRRNQNTELVREKLHRRMQIERNDLVGALLDHGEKTPPLPMETIQANASMLMLGGSETTSTLLCGVTYLLLTHPQSYQQVVQEVRATFRDLEDITLMSVSKLRFMHACISEALRRYPPTAGSQPRYVPKGGANVAGYDIPENSPFEYHPERFLGDQQFSSDRLGASEPFSIGPRSCIGRNLAYAQSRLILARILLCFDMELSKGNWAWMDQKHHIIWDKPPLVVSMKPYKHEEPGCAAPA
ncbi:hypothetical protein FGRMN_10681 [Fusarium graminum]|nr:hypothetical protein FGRMN_10681 [Fusarium graminum]